MNTIITVEQNSITTHDFTIKGEATPHQLDTIAEKIVGAWMLGDVSEIIKNAGLEVIDFDETGDWTCSEFEYQGEREG